MPTALVTGGNRGIGQAVATTLAREGWDVVIGARVPVAGPPLDLADPRSIDRFAARSGPVDLLVHNAGVAMDGFGPAVVEHTLAVNLFGPMLLTEALPLAPGAVVVNVSSGLAELYGYAPRLQARFRDPTLDAAGVRALAEEFAAAVRAGTWVKDGWPTSAYRVSKASLNAWTRALARARPGWRVNAVCPGWVRTRMGGAGAPRSVEEGAASVLWATRIGPDGPTGGFFRDGEPAED